MRVPPLSDPGLRLPELSHQLHPQCYWVWQLFLQKALPGADRLPKCQARLALEGAASAGAVPRASSSDWLGQGSPLLSLPLPPSHGPACWLEGDFLGHSEEECAKHSLGIETHPSLRKTPNPSLLWSGEVADQKGGAGAAEFTLNQSGHPASAHFLPPLKPTYFLSGLAEGKAGTGSLRGQQPSSCFLLQSIFFKESSSTR